LLPTSVPDLEILESAVMVDSMNGRCYRIAAADCAGELTGRLITVGNANDIPRATTLPGVTRRVDSLEGLREDVQRFA
jgi:hypothetical protein